MYNTKFLYEVLEKQKWNRQGNEGAEKDYQVIEGEEAGVLSKQVWAEVGPT